MNRMEVINRKKVIFRVILSISDSMIMKLILIEFYEILLKGISTNYFFFCGFRSIPTHF